MVINHCVSLTLIAVCFTVINHFVSLPGIRDWTPNRTSSDTTCRWFYILSLLLCSALSMQCIGPMDTGSIY